VTPETIEASDGAADAVSQCALPCDGAPVTARFTRITSQVPKIVSKVFELEDGALVKTTSASLTKGIAEVQSCHDLHEFMGVLLGLASNQCLTYGVTGASPLQLVTEAEWIKAGRPSSSVSRTESNFHWGEGLPGFLMLDHDPQSGMRRYTPADLIRVLRQVPELADVDLLTWPSASSLIFNRDTDECLSTMKGCRVYVMVQDATAIPKLGRYIVDSLWAAGHGVFAVSRAGRVLERGLFDTAVWQTNRLDFAAGAICKPPLEQRRGKPMLHPGSLRLVQRGVSSLTASQQEAASANKAAARLAVQTQASSARARYAEERTVLLEKAGLQAGRTAEVARARALDAVQAMLRDDAPELHGEAIVSVIRGDGTREELAVSDIIKRKVELDGSKTLDPIEPEYNGHSVVGKLFLSGPVPRLYSFAHGGATYKLVAQQGAVEVRSGSLHQAVDETLALLRGAGELYDHGDALATVSATGKLIPISSGLMPYLLSSRISFHRKKFDPATGQFSCHEVDPPQGVCKTIHELNGQRHLPRLNAVITAPIIVGGRLLDRQGYDATSGLVLVLPQEGTSQHLRAGVVEARQAFERLQQLFDSFPFDTPADRGVFLAALFTAVLRPGLRTAPGFAFDAPAQGTGKSLLAECVAIVGTGSAPSALPHLFDDEGEVRKRLVALLYAGAPAMIWDNIKGTFDSAVLAAMLTAEHFNDRLLGETKLLTLPNRMLALFNGNNMMLRGELTRRILSCRLDAGIERPYLRRFNISPRQVCLDERQSIVWDVLTIVRAHQTHAPGFAAEVSLGSFEEWSGAVLRPLLWATEASGDARVANPLTKIQHSEDDDEDLMALKELHRAWHTNYGDEPKTAREVIQDVDDESAFEDMADRCRENLRQAILDFVGEGFGRSSRSERARALGKQLSYRKGRVVDGCRRFHKLAQLASGGVARWSARMDGGQRHN
jgi:hypothetical protein